MRIPFLHLASLRKPAILIFLLMVSLLSCKSTADLTSVVEVDLNRYAGTWYEIARLPNSFERNMKCVTATYSQKDKGKISVMNRGYLPDPKGKWKTAKGIAWIPDREFPGRLKALIVVSIPACWTTQGRRALIFKRCSCLNMIVNKDLY